MMMEERPYENSYKAYVEVNVDVLSGGTMRPRFMTWEDVHRFEIDRVLSVKHRPALKAGGTGLHFEIEAMGRVSFVWFDGKRFFVERKVPLQQ